MQGCRDFRTKMRTGKDGETSKKMEKNWEKPGRFFPNFSFLKRFTEGLKRPIVGVKRVFSSLSWRGRGDHEFKLKMEEDRLNLEEGSELSALLVKCHCYSAYYTWSWENKDFHEILPWIDSDRTFNGEDFLCSFFLLV